jgi:hypothetical protein
VIARPLRGAVSESDLRALGLPDDMGLFVAHVHQEGPAMKAGLQNGDVLLVLAERLLDSKATFDAALEGYGEGDVVPVEYWRSKAQQRATVRLEGATTVFQRACDHGDANGCFSMGALLAQHADVGQNQAWALEFLKKGCKGGSADACVRLGRAFEEGALGAPQNQLRAAGLYEKACQQNLPSACLALATIYATPGGPLESQERAANLLQRACGWRDAGACHEIANRYERGDGVPQDPQRASSLHRVACDLGNEASCARAAASGR